MSLQEVNVIANKQLAIMNNKFFFITIKDLIVEQFIVLCFNFQNAKVIIIIQFNNIKNLINLIDIGLIG
jgi:hypothetical protein